jgi:uncharacterized membrane protein
MSNCKLPLGLLMLTIGIGLGLQVWYWPQLPERIAVHFNAKGQPDSWASRLNATILSVSLLVLIPLFFVGIGQVIRWLPSSMINLPHREFWLAPGRRDETLRWITCWMLWFSFGLAVFLVGINHLTFIANRDAQPLADAWSWVAVGAFLFVTLAHILLMIRRFNTLVSTQV